MGERGGGEHLANVLGALSLAVTTKTAAAVENASGLSLVQASALATLANHAEGGSVERLSRAVGLSHSATVRLVDRLVDHGLVRRRGSAGDARVAALHLTAKGRRVATAVRAARMDELETLLAELTAVQRAALAPLLDTLVAVGVDASPAGAQEANFVCRICSPDDCGHPLGCPVTRASTP